MKQCSDGQYVGRNPSNRCEFYECPQASGGYPEVTSFEISPQKVHKNTEVKLRCAGKRENTANTEIIITSPSGGSGRIASSAWEAAGTYLAGEEGVYTAYCKVTDKSGGVAKLGPSTFAAVSGQTRQACNSECCVFEDKFEDKFCGAGFKCESRKCEKVEQPTEKFREVPGITEIKRILESPAKFENLIVTVYGAIERGACATGGYGSSAATTSATEMATGRVTAAQGGGAPLIQKTAPVPVIAQKTAASSMASEQKCFPFIIHDGTGKLGLVGFGGNAEGRKTELKGVVRVYESGNGIIPFLKVEGRSDFDQPQTQIAPVAVPQFSQPQNAKTEECFKIVRKYAIRLAHNEEAKKAFKDGKDLWNYLDVNHQDIVSKLADACKDESEIVTEYLSRNLQSEFSKNVNYGYESRESQPAAQQTATNAVPIIVVTRDISNTQLDDLRKISGVSFNGPMPIEPLDKLTIVRMIALKENIDAIKKLPFVEDVKIDSINIIVHEDINKAFEQRPVEKFNISKDEILKKLEVIKSLSSNDDAQASLSESQDSVLQTSNSLEEFENETNKRGLGYTLGWILGAAAEQEKNDAEFLNRQVTQLENTISTLQTVSSSTEDITIRASLAEQVNILKKQAEVLKKEAESKSRNSGGILALIRNMFGG